MEYKRRLIYFVNENYSHLIKYKWLLIRCIFGYQRIFRLQNPFYPENFWYRRPKCPTSFSKCCYTWL